MKILVVSNSGQERIINLNNPTIEALSDNDLKKVTKSLRTSKNRMVCIIQDGNRILRWDRSYVSHAKNHWWKVTPDSFEILGTIENLHYLGKQN
ncbi:pilus assembly protein PilI [Escherichia coli]|uniref:Plasmid conjugative transfer protein PilI domain-containing protein n=1 Tax=Escherichia coli TaxID=562 RepID=A0A376YKC2_ECOLX|nr:pilus assembly protein PilI [Escherichia coli]EFI8984577.1 pilus assembly protein PilI [Escherichia coli]EGF1751176.1 pilus assembly protein PilI [Escherichia coli]EHK7519265.1 pilus assembly protein PilI [Escherichia coli]EJP6909605.1 pilus assembly protein PilI [Escherichia coli]